MNGILPVLEFHVNRNTRFAIGSFHALFLITIFYQILFEQVIFERLDGNLHHPKRSVCIWRNELMFDVPLCREFLYSADSSAVALSVFIDFGNRLFLLTSRLL